jgi:hypothetical protein
MQITTGRSGVPTVITPFFLGIRGSVTYQIDDREPGVIPAADIDGSTIRLPRSLIPTMKAGRQLRVSVTPVGAAAAQTQVFSLLGFTAASKWLERDICQFQESQEATGEGGGTALDVSLTRAVGGTIKVIGETKLPDGMALMIDLRIPD